MNKVENILETVDAAEYIGQYVKLKADGAEFRGLCPFHDEKTPSFTLYQADKWRYQCFGCGAQGDIIDFAMDYHGITFTRASKLLSGKLINPEPDNTRKRERIVQPSVYKGYTPIVPIPKLPPDQRIRPQRATPLITNPKRGGKQSTITPNWVYPYYRADGKLVCYVLRIDLDNGKKITPTISWCERPDGSQGWVYMRPKSSHLMPYNSQFIKSRPEAPILIVEGEKCADAAPRLLPAYVPLSWLGGTNAVDKTDWSCVKGKKVLILPDNDEMGHKAAAKIADIVKSQGAVDIKMLQPDQDKPKGWDIADAAATGGMTSKEYVEYLKPRLQVILDGSISEPVNPVSPANKSADPDPVKQNIVANYSATGEPPTIAWWDISERGQVLGTIRNFKLILDAYGISVKYNAMTKDVEIVIPNLEISTENYHAVAESYLISICNAVRFPTANVADFLAAEADNKAYHPAHYYVSSQIWDGEDRISQLSATLNSADPELTCILLRRWLISGIAALYSQHGVAAQGCLVLVGGQYSGKTTWLKNLTKGHPEFVAEGITLNPSDRDSVNQALQYWIVELGELDATFRKSDIAALKAFLTRDRDIFRRAYAKRDAKFSRRTIFAASVNSPQYLQDETGNRRYWTIKCEGRLDAHHDIDMQQVWAQAKNLYEKGEPWALSLDEMERLNGHNENFKETEPMEELLISFYDPKAPIRHCRLTCTDVLLQIGFDKPTRQQARALSPHLRNHFGEPSRSNGRNIWKMPESRGGRPYNQ